MDNYSIRNSNNTYSVSMNIRNTKGLYSDNNSSNSSNSKDCKPRSASGIPCMHSALHSSIIAYIRKFKRNTIDYSIRKGLYSDKKTIVDRW